MKTLVILSQKGGTGKTTMAVHLAVEASRSGKTVALIDLDPQASAAKWGDTRSDDTPIVINVSTTQKYIGVNYATARETVEAIALEAKASSSAEAHPHDDSDRATSDERDRTDQLSYSIGLSAPPLKRLVRF